jgi:predicted ATPase/class 3 adenylate cyclase
VSTISDWLRSLGLTEYEERFAKEDVDFDLLGDLTDHDFDRLGVSVGHRRRMLRAIRQPSPTDAGGPQPARAIPSAPQHAPAPESKPQDTAERRQLTILFCDLVGSTKLSTKLDPEDLRGIISSYHRCCTELVERNGGFVAKYMGDGVLAYFGYPRANEHDAERAVRAGLALVEAVPKLVTAADAPLQVRVGIGTGLVVVGDLIGSGAAQEQAVVGETPNLAARLQALAEPGSVVISASTRQLTGGLFEYRDLGAVALKGFAERTPALQVLGASAAESRFEALRATTTPLVGRAEEIDLLMRRWDQAKASDGQVVLICGEPGIGKSRITQTIAERISGEPHTRLRYFCSPHHQDSALYPSITQLERAAGFRREDTAEERLSKLETVIAPGTNDLREAAPLLADLLSIPTGDRYPPLNLTPQKRKEKTLQAQLAQVEGLAARQPLLMVWEDIHWSDPTTREVLDLLVDRIATLRVLVVLTFRPEFASPWIGRPHVTLLTLSRLAPRQRAQMIGYVTGGKSLPKEIADQIVDRTDGVPLFIEELTKNVLESGIVADAGDRYVAEGPVAPLAIPTSLHASLLARLDRLVPTREIAQIGAALGRSFSHELISAAAQMPEDQVDDALAKLVKAELIFRRGTPPQAEYTFKHALVQDAAYSTLLHSRRQQLHARITETLEKQFSEIAAAQPLLMAHHCAEAGLAGAAARYRLKAGHQAVARSAMAEAVTQLQKGLDLLSCLPDGPVRQEQELHLRMALGPALIATKGYSADDVGETIARARVLADQLDRPEYLVSLLYGRFHFVRGEHRRAMLDAEQIERLGESQNDQIILELGHFYRAVVHFQLGEFTAARALFEQCHGLLNQTSSTTHTAEDPRATVRCWLAVTFGYLGYLDRGCALINEGLSVARHIQQSYTLGFALIYAAWFESVTVSPDEARRYADEAIALSNEQGFPIWLALGMTMGGWSRALHGQSSEGLTLLMNGLALMRAIGSICTIPWVLVKLAEARMKLGEPREAFECLIEAQRTIETNDERRDEAEVHRLRGDLLTATGDWPAAEENYRRALTVARVQSAKTYELRAATSLARLWQDQGKRAEAHDLLSPVYGWFTEGFDTPVLKEAKALLDELSGASAVVPAASD